MHYFMLNRFNQVLLLSSCEIPLVNIIYAPDQQLLLLVVLESLMAEFFIRKDEKMQRKQSILVRRVYGCKNLLFPVGVFALILILTLMT